MGWKQIGIYSTFLTGVVGGILAFNLFWPTDSVSSDRQVMAAAYTAVWLGVLGMLSTVALVKILYRNNETERRLISAVGLLSQIPKDALMAPVASSARHLKRLCDEEKGLQQKGEEMIRRRSVTRAIADYKPFFRGQRDAAAAAHPDIPETLEECAVWKASS